MQTDQPATLVNTTPHPITIFGDGGASTKYDPSAKHGLRLDADPLQYVGVAHGVLVHEPPRWSGLALDDLDLSDVKGPIDLLVSMPVGDFIRASGVPQELIDADVQHVYGPDTSKAAVREGGNIIGSKELVRYF